MRTIILCVTLVCLFACNLQAQYNINYAGKIEYADSIHLSGCWGYTADDGKEYALVGTTHGTSIVDVTDPTAPEDLFFISGGLSTWREIKTWNHHAYVTTEAYDGLLIIDLSNLPFSIDTISYRGTAAHPFNTAHTLYIDESGYGYLFGFNLLTGATEGAYIVDLNVDPMHPEYIAEFTNVYIHDGFVRNDTLWAAAIYEGAIYVYDITNKNDFNLLGIQPTSASAAHNCWLSDDGKYLFTTDEIWTGFITSFDVTDLSDIKSLDQIKHGAADSTIAHNTYYLNGFIITAHYSEGVTIHDARRPDNLIEVAHYDTSPFGPDVLLEGAWGVYPYFPSGTIIISDITEGLIVLQPEYVQAAHLEGTVKDDVSFNDIIHARIELSGTSVIDSTDILGVFRTGYHEAGMYDVTISKTGCSTKTISDVALVNGEVTTLDILLDCGTIGVQETFNADEIHCFYQAATATIIVQLDTNENGVVKGRLFNTDGKLVHDATLQSSGELHIDAATLPTGLYYFEFTNGKAHFTQKLMVY